MRPSRLVFAIGIALVATPFAARADTTPAHTSTLTAAHARTLHRAPARVLPHVTPARGGGPQPACDGADRTNAGMCAAPDLAPTAPQNDWHTAPTDEGPHASNAP